MIGVGDKVVSVTLAMSNCPCVDHPDQATANGAKSGCVYVVSRVVNNPGWDCIGGLHFVGFASRSPAGYCAGRFRKINAADDDFTEMLRRIKPVIPTLEPVKTKVRKLDPAIWGDGVAMGDET